MIIYPAIDIIDGKAVRLLNGDYGKKTVYGNDPVKIALDFKNSGAENIHIVDLDGAKSGKTPNFPVISDIVKSTNLFAEVGGGIRDMKTARQYINAGVGRVILGTAAAKNPEFLKEAVFEFGDKIAVGIDVKDGFVAINGWTEKTELTVWDFIGNIENIGVKTVICTDVSFDGAMRGTNVTLYKKLVENTGVNIIASGGVSTLTDVSSLKEAGVYGAIIGKAYYVGAIDIKKAIEVAR